MKLLLLILTTFTFSYASADCNFNASKFQQRIDKKNISSIKRFLNRSKNKEFNTPKCLSKALMYTMSKNNFYISNFLLTQKIDLNYIDHSTHMNPITTAIKFKRGNELKALLKAGADANLVIEGKTMLDYAIERDHFLSITLLKFHGAKETRDCSLKNSMIPKCYHKRDKPILKIALVYYGAEMKMSDLDRIEPILVKRFYEATDRNVEIKVISKKVIGFKKKMPEGYTYNKITDKKRLQRIWYYDNVGAGIMNEVYEEYKKTETDMVLEDLDAIVGITGGQFDGLGFASGRVSVTEYPQEIAWGIEGGGRVNYPSDYKIVDELIHELGHNMFLGHTSTQCQKSGLTLEQREACCAKSPTKDDVLSYCRDRNAVDESFMHGFESCNVEMIQDLIVPAMLSGGEWQVKPRKVCK